MPLMLGDSIARNLSKDTAGKDRDKLQRHVHQTLKLVSHLYSLVPFQNAAGAVTGLIQAVTVNAGPLGKLSCLLSIRLVVSFVIYPPSTAFLLVQDCSH